MKHWGVGYIAVSPVDRTGEDGHDRRPVFLHHMNLDWRGVGPQQVSPLYIESILHVPGGMVCRNIEGLEIVVVCFDFRTDEDGKTHSGEDAKHLIHHRPYGMEMPGANLAPSKRYIQAPSLDPMLNFAPSVSGQSLIDLLCKLCL